MIAPRVGFLLAFLTTACLAHAFAGSLVLVDRAIAPAVKDVHVVVADAAEAAAAIAVPMIVEAVTEVMRAEVIDNIDRNHCHPAGRAAWIHRAATGFDYWNTESDPTRDPWQLRVAAAHGLAADERCDLVRYGADVVAAGMAEQAAAFGSPMWPGPKLWSFRSRGGEIAYIDAGGIPHGVTR